MIYVEPPADFARIEFRSVREMSVRMTSCNVTSVILEKNSIRFVTYVKTAVAV